MHTFVKAVCKKLLLTQDYRLYRCRSGEMTGVHLEDDLTLIIRKDDPVCFDVGANVGQSIEMFRALFRAPRTFSFEPASRVFQQLVDENYGAGVSLNNFALGEENQTKDFINCGNSEWSSFLRLPENGRAFSRARASECRVETVQMRTLDWFVQTHGIECIDLIKIDTQGYEMNVLSGGSKSFKSGIVRNVLIELNFIELYEQQSDPRSIADFLGSCDLGLVDYYEKVREGNRLAWCTALFSKA